MLGAVIVIVLLALLVWLVGLLIKMTRKHPNEHTTFRTSKSAQEVADEIRKVAGELGAGIEKIEADPLGEYGPADDIAVVLFGKNKDVIRSDWAVQVYAKSNEENGCDIELIALSQQARGTYSGTNIEESRAKCELIASRLR